jgi:hypothetical protein
MSLDENVHALKSTQRANKTAKQLQVALVAGISYLSL